MSTFQTPLPLPSLAFLFTRYWERPRCSFMLGA